jgi:hypothetical protein
MPDPAELPDRRRLRFRRLSCALVVVGLLLAGWMPVASLGVGTLGRLGSSSSSLIAEAIASLESGNGPARGARSACTLQGAASAVCGSIGAASTDASWVKGQGASPPARDLASMTYDSVDKEVVLFGGCGRICALNETWVFAAGSWSNITGTTGPTPPGRSDAAMTFYSPSNTSSLVLMFGGINPGGFLQDTWGFILGKWTKILAASGGYAVPAPRFGASLAYDAKDGYAVLFGGGGFYKDRTFLNDTWTFTFPRWTHLTTPTAPSARLHAAMAYDPTLGKIVLFGGALVTGFGKDTWEFSGGSWTQLTLKTEPILRMAALFQYYPAGSEIILFGGLGKYGFDNDTWAFNGTWHQLVMPGPSGRVWSASAYDASSGEILLYGGWNLSVIYGDLWGFGNNSSFAISAPASSAPPVAGTAPAELVMMMGSAVPVWVGGRDRRTAGLVPSV